MVTAKSTNTLLSEIRVFLKAYNRSLDTGNNSLTKDLLLTPFSVGARLIMEQVGLARDLHILSKQKNTDLDNEATNYTLERSTGTYATVTLTFYATALPTADIVIPAGTQCRTSGTSFASPVLFSTISAATFPAGSLSSYYSYDRTRYEFTVPAMASAIGESGNVGSDLISSIVNTVPHVNGVTNLTASSGGSGTEDDDDFRTRIKLKKLGRDLNTVNGLRGFMRAHGFLDAYAIRIEDALAERATGIDIFAIDQYSTAITETFAYYPNMNYLLWNSPVVSVTSVVSAVVGVISDADYDVHIDNSSALRRSVDALDYISVRASASIPVGTAFTVTYTYSQNIANIQNTFALETNQILTAGVLAKRAFPLTFYINAKLTLTANADGPSTRNVVRNALVQYFSNYRMGQSIQKSDIIIVMQQGYGDYPVTSVDAVVISSYYLQDEFGVNYLPIDEVITVGTTQYAVYGNAVLS